MFEKSLTRFRKVALMTIVATIFLIWVGGWVRSTGAGMGCPDWPKCFGRIIPPTSISELPPDYKEHYSDLRKKKNESIAKRLEKMGFGEVAQKMTNDPKIYIEEDFNAYKTWTEYINRLVGVLVGLLIFITMIFSFSLYEYDKRITFLSIAGFILVGLEGWLGSIVVSTNLMPGIITLHMLLAMILLIVLINAYQLSSQHSIKSSFSPALKYIGILSTFMVLVQILLGTQLREAVDVAKDSLGENQRSNWLVFTGSIYNVHRLFYYALTAVILFFAYRLKSIYKSEKSLKIFASIMVITLFLEIGIGIGMHYFNIPPILQPLHLLFSALIFTSTYHITYLLIRSKKN